jgi:hypothetical protein
MSSLADHEATIVVTTTTTRRLPKRGGSRNCNYSTATTTALRQLDRLLLSLSLSDDDDDDGEYCFIPATLVFFVWPRF